MRRRPCRAISRCSTRRARWTRFEAFASVHGARFYGLPLNGSTLTLRRARCDVPQDIALPGGGSLHPFLGGSTLPWVLED